MITDDAPRAITAPVLRLQQALARARLGYAQYLDELDKTFSWCLGDINATYQRQVDEARSADQERVAAALAAFDQSNQEIRERINGMAVEYPWAVASWEDKAWAAYAPDVDAALPACVRVGQLELSHAPDLPPLPAMARLVGSGHLFLRTNQETRPTALRLLQSILLRLIVSTTPGAMRLVLCDPVSVGANLALFRQLPDALRGPKIWAGAQEIDTKLKELASHIESVIQTRLIRPDATIEEYNSERPEQRVPYHMLALADLPAAFTDGMAESLLTIARNGPRAGVYIVASVDMTYSTLRDFSIDHLTALGTTLSFDDAGHLQWDDPLFARHAVLPDRMPPSPQVDGYLTVIGLAAARSTVDLSFRRIAISAEEQWQGSTLDGLSIPIGLTPRGEQHDLDLGQDPGVIHHGLIGGTIGSGKGNLLHVMITQLALRYPPEELGLYLLDFKEGVEFQRYMRLPQARAVALESEREFGLNVLRHLQTEMEERGRLFKSTGPSISKYADYRRHTGKPLPRLVLIIDEFQVLFKDDDAMARDAAQILEDLAKRGRSAAIHVLLCSQSPSTGGQLLTRIYDQMALRIALQCRVRDALAILGEGNDAAAHLEKVGEAIYNDKMGDKEKNHIIRVALLREQEHQQALTTIASLVGDRQYPRPITFDGHAVARLPDNEALRTLLADPLWLSPKSPPHVWLGEPVDLQPPTAAILDRYPRANLLIVGDHTAQANGLLLAALLGLAAQHAPSDAAFYVADFSRAGDPQVGLIGSQEGGSGGAFLPHTLNKGGSRQAGTLLEQLLTILKERLVDDALRLPRLYFFIVGMHRWRELRGPDTITQSEAGKQLMRLADEGPDVGIHLIAWADSLAIVEQALKRGGFKYFDFRVALRLSQRDSGELFGSSAAATLEDNRAFFRYEDWEMGRREKFKPYAIPSGEDLQYIVTRLAAKAAAGGTQ